MEDKYSAADVLQALGVPYKVVKNTKIKCPRCGKDSFYMNLERSVGNCFRASCGFKGNQVSYYAEAMGISTKEANKQMMAYMGYSNSNVNTVKIQPKMQTKLEFGTENELIDIDSRNIAYIELKRDLGLIKRHRNDLHCRGLTDYEIEKNGYCSYPYKKDLENVARHLISKGISLKGIPGFYINENKNWSLRPLKHGFLFPYKDSKGRIQGYQLRKDDELLKTYMDTDGNKNKEKKCNWMSSTGLEQGSSCKGFVHYATEFIEDFMTEEVRPYIPNGKIYMTEGGLKGDIIHLLTDWPVICVPGVTSLNEFEKELDNLISLGVKEIVNLYDMDYLTNKNVEKALENTKEMIEKKGIIYTRETWNTEVPNHKPLKGYDDYLMYHIRGI